MVQFHLYEAPRIVKFIQSKSILVVARRGVGRVEREKGELVFSGDRASV